MKRIAILGSTGSIGIQTLEVARHLGLSVVALALGSRIEGLREQIREFHPKVVAVFDREKAAALQKEFPDVRVVTGQEGLCEVATLDEVEVVVSAISGFAGLLPTLSAIKKGKRIALASKEILVAAGSLVMSLAKQYKAEILPVDSEHSALFQCLEHKDKAEVRRLILTASGGPFFRRSKEELASVTLKEALQHPSWKMGPKITVDSSTLMNKGLEVIEASVLFEMPPEKIEVVIHPQSVVHSLVEMQDGALLAKLSAPSMTLPIQYAITYPRREKGILPPFSFLQHPKLEFFMPEQGKFICLDLCYAALREGGSVPCFLNAANEVLVGRFLKGEIGWQDIGNKLETLLHRHRKQRIEALEVVLEVDAEGRREALTI